MWTHLRKEIETIRRDLGITDKEFKPLGLTEWKEVEEKIYQAFCVITHYNERHIRRTKSINLILFEFNRKTSNNCSVW